MKQRQGGCGAGFIASLAGVILASVSAFSLADDSMQITEIRTTQARFQFLAEPGKEKSLAQELLAPDGEIHTTQAQFQSLAGFGKKKPLAPELLAPDDATGTIVLRKARWKLLQGESFATQLNTGHISLRHPSLETVPPPSVTDDLSNRLPLEKLPAGGFPFGVGTIDQSDDVDHCRKAAQQYAFTVQSASAELGLKVRFDALSDLDLKLLRDRHGAKIGLLEHGVMVAGNNVDRFCLGTAEELPKELLDRGLLNAVAVLLVAENPGDPLTARCSGLLYHGKFVTARHCFVDADGSGSPDEFSELAISTLGQPDILYKVNPPPAAEFHAYSHLNDWIALSFSDASPPTTQITWDNATIVAPVIILGPFRYADLTRSINDAGPIWRHGIRWTKNQSCIAGYDPVEPSCLYHACITLGGYSGSPMIEADHATGLRVAGLHVGAKDDPQRVECQGHSDVAGIVNVAIPSKVISF